MNLLQRGREGQYSGSSRKRLLAFAAAAAVVLAAGLAIPQGIDTDRITVLNPQSYPLVGSTWTVDLDHAGGYLEVRAVDGTAFGGDIKFARMYSDGGSAQPLLAGGDTVRFEWLEGGLWHFEVEVLTDGPHHMLFGTGGDAARASNMAALVDVISATPNGTYSPNDEIDVRLVFGSPASLERQIAADGATDSAGGSFEELEGVEHVTTVTMGSSVYAIAAASQDDGIQIIDVTDPPNPIAVASATDDTGNFTTLKSANDVKTFNIHTSTYAVVASPGDNGIQVIDITDPRTPVPVSALLGNSTLELAGASSIAVDTSAAPQIYAYVGYDNGIRVIDLSDPSAPVPIASISDSESLNLGGVSSIATAWVWPSMYLVATGQNDNGIQIIDITDPSNPSPVARVDDNADLRLRQPTSVAIAQMNAHFYALVASMGEPGLQIINITEPASPTAIFALVDEFGTGSSASRHVASLVRGNSMYAVTASGADDTVRIIDITDPATPIVKARVAGDHDGFDALNMPSSVHTFSMGSERYALVGSRGDDAVQVIKITDPANPANPNLPPYIELAVSSPPGRAYYVGPGSDDRTLLFSYKVGVGDETADLDYVEQNPFHVGSNQFVWNGSALARFSLPAPGEPHSLGANKDIEIGPGQNRPPVLGPVGDRAVDELSRLAFSVTAEDPDYGDSYNFSLTRSPIGASITAGGVFSWTPIEPLDGMHLVTVAVTDQAGATDSETFYVTVREVGVSPILREIAPLSVDELETLMADISVEDPDNNDVHTFAVSGAPGATIFRNGTLVWTPTEQQDGIHEITVTVSDRTGESDSMNATVTVNEVNVPPILDEIGDLSVRDREPLSFSATVTDPDNNETHTFELQPHTTDATMTPAGAFSWTPTEAHVGENEFTVDVMDGSGGSDSKAFTVTVIAVDRDAPVPSLGTGGGDVTNSQRIEFWADFGEEIRLGSFSAVKMAASSGQVTEPTSADGQNFTFAVVGAEEGELAVSIPAGGIQDLEGNLNVESNNVTVLVDRTAPSTALSTESASPTGAERVEFTATFGEPVDESSLDAGAIYTSSGAVEHYFLNDTALLFRVQSPASGALGVHIPAGVVQDPAGNPNAPSGTVSIEIARNVTAPAVTALTQSPTNAERVAFQVDFDKAITSFTEENVNTSSGTVSAPTQVNDRGFTFSIDNPGEGELMVSVSAGSVQTAGGHSNIVSNTAVVIVDRTGPAPTVSALTESPTSAQAVTFKAEFDEEINPGTFGPGDVNASSGSVSNVRQTGKTSFAFDVSGADSGTLEVYIPAGKLQDLAGNDNIESGRATVEIDRDGPVPAIAALTVSPSSEDVIRFEVDFGKEIDPATFTEDSVYASSGDVLPPTRNTDWQFAFSVENPAEGSLDVSIPAGMVQDQLGNPNAASNVTTVDVDRTGPVPRITAVTPSPTNSTLIKFEVNFDGPIKNGTFTLNDVEVTSGVGISIMDHADNQRFEIHVEPQYYDHEPQYRQVTVFIPDGAVEDPLGNPGTASNVASVTYDLWPPVVIQVYVLSPDRMVVMYEEVVDMELVDGTAFDLGIPAPPGTTEWQINVGGNDPKYVIVYGSVISNTDPELETSLIYLDVSEEVSNKYLFGNDLNATITDAVGNHALAHIVRTEEVENGTVPEPIGTIGHYEAPREITSFIMDEPHLPRTVLAHGPFSIDYVTDWYGYANATAKSFQLADHFTNLTAPVGQVYVTVSLPEYVTATGGASWNGSFYLPAPSDALPPSASGTFDVRTPRIAVSLGFDDQLLLDRAVRIYIPGEGGHDVFVSNGISPSRQSLECTFEDSQEAADANLLAGEECYIYMGGDLVIWTRHLSHWGTYSDGSGPIPGGQNPESQNPESQDPNSQNPESQNPESQDPNSQNPESQNPESQNPESQNPDNGNQGSSSSKSSRSGGGGGGGGGAPVPTATDVRLYSVSWDCTAGIASVTVGPDTDQLTVRIRTSSAGERPVTQVDGLLPGGQTYTVNISNADTFLLVEASLAYENGYVITKIVNLQQCVGEVTFDRFVLQQVVSQLEICRGDREPALRDSSHLLCLFYGTFDVLTERGWSLTRP